MKTNFATAAIAATYIAISVQGQNLPRFLDDTCAVETNASMKQFLAYEIDDEIIHTRDLWLKGRDERALCINHSSEVEVGHDNRAWVLERVPG